MTRIIFFKLTTVLEPNKLKADLFCINQSTVDLCHTTLRRKALKKTLYPFYRSRAGAMAIF